MDSHWEKCIYQLNSRCLIEHDYDYSKLFLLLAPILLLLLLLFVVLLIKAPPHCSLLSVSLQSGGENGVAGIIIVNTISDFITLHLRQSDDDLHSNFASL